MAKETDVTTQLSFRPDSYRYSRKVGIAMKSPFAALLLLLLISAKSSQAAESFTDVILGEVTEAAKFYFSKNPKFDDTGFNVIGVDEDWSATELFQQQYGQSASTARFVGAILDFQYFEAGNVSFTDVYQLILVGEHQDARKAFAVFSLELVRHLTDANLMIEDIEQAQLAIRQRFRTIYSLVGNDNYASFLNLKLGSSLSFVMDTTGSMAGEIAAAKASVVDIVQQTNGTNSAPLNYVLVPYSDPGFGPVTKTSDAHEFISEVDKLFASGGGDAPELAMIGILLAAQNSNFRSIVYVFTDAEAKDTKLQNHVIALCLLKKISVNIFLTTRIAKRKKRSLLTGRSLYENIGDLTGGSVVFVNKEDIASGTEIMKASTVQGLVTLVSKSTNASSVAVYVDSSISSIIVQFTGTFSYRRYDSDVADHNVTRVTLADISDVLLFRLDGLSPGKYIFHFDANTSSPYGALIRGRSGLGFHAHLSQRKRGADDGTFVASRQLLAGVETRAEMTLYGDAERTNFTKFQLVSRGGAVLVEIPLTKLSDTQYIAGRNFLLPKEPMFVRLTGYYDNKMVERIDPCAITPTVSESYLEDIQDVRVFAGESIQVSTVLHNKGDTDTFIVLVSDIQEFVKIQGADSTGAREFSSPNDGTRTLTLDITVPAGTPVGVLSKVLLTATGVTDNYFVFTTFVISVQDRVTRCPTPNSPDGGELRCVPDATSVGSSCNLQCGEEYVLEGEGSMTCQNDGTWSPGNPGICRLLGSKTCIVSGDPHYTTFDGLYYDFQGSCMYTLLETHPGSTVEPVIIQTENGIFYGRNQVSWMKQAFVTVYNITVHFKMGKIVLIDGIRVTLPVILRDGDLQIKLDGGDVLLSTGFKMEVRFNGRHFFRVTLPARYIDQVSGLCGNYDDETSNEMMVGNQTFTAGSEFGNSLEIIGGSEPWCRKGQPNDNNDGCDNEALRALYAERCAAIKSDCFHGCADNQTLDAVFNGCVYDLCQMNGNEKTVEDAIKDFATSCAEKGIQICDWRERFDFPTPICEVNAHYEFQANRCPNTCVNPSASNRCRHKTRIEGCVCNDNFVRDGTDCVRNSDCGCAFQGRYYKKDESFLQNQCTQKCECQKNGVLECSPNECDEGTECRVLNSGVLGCAQTQVNQFCATGDPHYKTLDGSRYNFMGICRYIMMKTKNDMIADSDRHIIISAQNENRNGNTRVSYVRAVYIEVGEYEVKLGPDTSVTVMRNGTELDDGASFQSKFGIFSTRIAGRFAQFISKFGISAKFDGSNLCVDVPSFYMHKVHGMGGNYTGSRDDDFGGKSIEDFAAGFIYGDGCKEEVKEPFICSDEDKAKWGGPEFCGKMKDSEGPFQYCNATTVDVNVPFDNCVFDACATEGDPGTITKAIESYAQECLDKGGPLQCNWEAQLGIVYKCQENSRYDGCASICEDTCQNARAVERCQSDEKVGRCVCNLGYILDKGECVKESTCGCVFEDGKYHEQGHMLMASDCESRITCVGAQNLDVTENPCGEAATCQGEDEKYECVPNELPHALIYGGIHFKTFDDKYFDFGGNCGYLLAKHTYREDAPSKPSWGVYIVKNGMTKIEKVIVEIWRTPEMKRTITIGRDLSVMVDGIRARFGTKTDSMGIHYKRGDAVLNFQFGLHINFNGDDWVRVDVEKDYHEKLHGIAGNFNGNPDDDFLIGDIMRTKEQWGDFWYRDRYSSEECTQVTPMIDMPCLLEKRFKRNCDCGMLVDKEGPFAACHEKIDPEPFMRSCVKDACLHDGSAVAIAKVLKAYHRACFGKGIPVEDWRGKADIPMECPVHSHYQNCTKPCQPTCGNPKSDCFVIVCEEGCVCDEGYILSGTDCIEIEKCGCTSDDGHYYEHGACLTKEGCTEKCTCVYGEWNCEPHSCNDMQSCRIMKGELGCYWKDPCKYDNGGCSDICDHDDEFNLVCSCRSARILGKDNVSCIDISPVFFNGSGNSCGTTFNIWKAEFQTWQNVYLPEWMKELEGYKKYIEHGIVSADLNVCQYQWTEWYDSDDPEGCGDEETLDKLRFEYPEICRKPIWAEGRLSDGRKIGSAMAKFEVDENGLVCKNADQEKGLSCPDFSVRFLCRVTQTPPCE